jgi:hypothetical protein
LTHLSLADRIDDFNRRFTRIIENDDLSTEGKNLAIGMLVTLYAPLFREVPKALRGKVAA